MNLAANGPPAKASAKKSERASTTALAEPADGNWVWETAIRGADGVGAVDPCDGDLIGRCGLRWSAEDRQEGTEGNDCQRAGYEKVQSEPLSDATPCTTAVFHGRTPSRHP